MSDGLCWLPELEDLAEDMCEAVVRFQVKFGKRPNVCRMRDSEFKTVYGIKIIPDETVLPGHFLLCCEEAKNGDKV